MFKNEAKRFLYDLKVELAKKGMIQQFQSLDSTAKLNTDYLDYHNDTCPRCQTKLKVYNGTVKKIGTLSAFHYIEKNEVFIYALCRSCVTNDLIYTNSSAHSEKAQTTEDVILKALNID